MKPCHPDPLITTGLAALLVLVPLAVLAGIGGPYGEYSMAYQGPETLTLLVIPDGSGNAFDQAFLPNGGYEDATITLLVKDGLDYPVADLPREAATGPDGYLLSTGKADAARTGLGLGLRGQGENGCKYDGKRYRVTHVFPPRSGFIILERALRWLSHWPALHLVKLDMIVPE